MLIFKVDGSRSFCCRPFESHRPLLTLGPLFAPSSTGHQRPDGDQGTRAMSSCWQSHQYFNIPVLSIKIPRGSPAESPTEEPVVTSEGPPPLPVLKSTQLRHAGTILDSSVYVPPATSRHPLAGVTQAENCRRDSSCFMAP